MEWAITLALGLIVFCCLLAGPIAFALVMRLFDRIDTLEKLNDKQSQTFKQLSQLCHSLQNKQNEQEKFAKLQQLSQQATPDLTVQTAPEPQPFPTATEPEPESIVAEVVSATIELQPPTIVTAERIIKEEPTSFLFGALTSAKQTAEEQCQTAPVAPVDFAAQPRVEKPPLETTPFEQPQKPTPPLQTPHSTLKTSPPKKQTTNHKPQSTTPWLSLELLIGRKVLPWVACILFLLFAVFLLQYAFEHGFITEIHKTFGMGLLSIIFLGAGKYFAVKRLRYFSTVLTSAGISIAFLTGYATYGFYQLLPVQYATGIMTGVVIGSFLLSRYYVSRLLGIISIIGGLAVPILLHSGIDRYNEFFSYLILLNIGTIVLINVMKRPPIAMLAFLGTQVEFWLWYRGNWHADKLVSVLIFQAAFYLVYLIDTSLATLRPKQKATWDDAIRAIVSPLLFYATSWFLLKQSEPEFLDQCLGVLTFAFSAWYAIFAVIYARRLSRIWNRKANDELRLYWNGGPAAATTMSLAFLALAIPLQFEANAITVGWVAIGAALWCFGNKLINRTFVNMSVVFLALGLGRMLTFDFLHRDITLTTPLANGYAMPIFAAGLVLCLAGCLGHHILRNIKQTIFDRHREWQTTPNDRRRPHTAIEKFFNDGMIAEWDFKWQFNYAIGYIGLLIAAVILSIESFEYFRLRPDDFIRPVLAGSYSLTVLWSIIGLLLMMIALAHKTPTIRVASIIMFALVSCKLLLADLVGRTTFALELEPIFNPITAAMTGVSLVLVALPLISRICDRRSPKEIRLTIDILGWCGAIALFVIASFECYYYFLKYPLNLENVLLIDNRVFFAHASLSVLWGLIALVSFAVGMFTRKQPIRIAAIVILVLTGIKIVTLELFARPSYIFPVVLRTMFPDSESEQIRFLAPSLLVFVNPYFMTIFTASLVAIIAGVWAARIRPLTSESERMAFAASGVCGLLFVIISSSIEIWQFYTYYNFDLMISTHFVPSATDWFQARAALTVFWSTWAIVLFIIGMTCRSQILRTMAMLLLTLVAGFIATTQLFVRPDAYEMAVNNPYFLTIAFAFITMIVLAVWGTRLQRLASNEERGFLTVIGLGGLGLAWGAMTVECYSYFHIHTELHKTFIANTSVTVFWTLLAVLVALIGGTAKSKVLRYAAVVLLGVTLCKAAFLELTNRPDDFATLLNPFMLSMTLLSLALMTLAVIATRIRPAENIAERQIMFAVGLAGLMLIWYALSDECFTYFRERFEIHSLFIANASLTVFWTLFSIAILLVSQCFRSLRLRAIALVLLMITFAKAIPLELIQRPDDLSPLANPYMPVLTLLSLVMIGIGVFALGRSTGKPAIQMSTEHLTGQVLAFAGLAMLFVCSSIECHDSVRANIGDEKAVWVAQMAISMLWSVFAGVLVFIGIVWRSASLRWVAITLFAVTTFKVVVYDMAEFDRIYRIGAFFVLALVMMLAAWAYQRFKPELDKKQPEPEA